MPLYFFHVRDGRSAPDSKGMNLSSIDHARLEAIRFSGELMARRAEAFENDNEWSLEVKSHTGLTLFILHFALVEAPVLRHCEQALAR